MAKKSNPFKKAPVRLSLERSEGVETNRKFATAKVLKWGFYLYMFWILKTCFSVGGTPPKKNTNGNVQTYGVEYMMPSNLNHYKTPELDFKGQLGRKDVYKNGIQLGSLAQAYILTNDGDEVIGFLTNGKVYNSLGVPTGDIYQDKILDFGGNEVGTLKTENKKLESIVNGEKELANVEEICYTILTKDPKTKEYLITGIVDDYNVMNNQTE